MSEKRRQHYVPRFYLKNFSIDRKGLAIGTFNIPSNKFISTARLKTQAYEIYFYGKDNRIENSLGLLEQNSATVIKDIIRANSLPNLKSKEFFTLLSFAIFLKSRTLYAAEENRELVEKSVKAIYSKDSRLKDHLNNIHIIVNDPTKIALRSAAQCLPIAFDLDYKLLINRTCIPFITSDNPVIYYNQFMETKKAFATGTGLACKGLEIFLPLSPEHYVIFFDKDVYKFGSRKDLSVIIRDLKDIESLNKLQCISAYKNLYFDHSISREAFTILMNNAEKNRRRTKLKVDEYTGPTDKEGMHSLLHFHRTDIKCELHLGFIKILKKARQYELGNRVLHVRNERTYHLYEEFLDLVDRGKHKISDFYDFLKQQTQKIDSIGR